MMHHGVKHGLDQEITTHLSKDSVAICLVTHNHSDGPQVIDTVQLLALQLHLVVHAPQVFGPAR